MIDPRHEAAIMAALHAALCPYCRGVRCLAGASVPCPHCRGTGLRPQGTTDGEPIKVAVPTPTPKE